MFSAVKIWGGLAVALVVVGMSAYALHAVYRYGRQVEQIEIMKALEKAGKNAEKNRSDYRKCVDTGGLYNFETNHCER